MSVSSSSWGLGRAAVCDCGTPWTFLLPFLEEDKTLKDMLIMARTMETALKHAECMEKNGQNHSGSNEESMDKIRSSKSLRKQPLKHFPRQQPVRNGHVNRPRTATNRGNQKCRNFGGAYPHQSKCPAFGMECHYCYKRNVITFCQCVGNGLKCATSATT